MYHHELHATLVAARSIQSRLLQHVSLDEEKHDETVIVRDVVRGELQITLGVKLEQFLLIVELYH